MSDHPEELYVPIDPATGLAILKDADVDFDHLSEGAPVAIYHFGGTATVKVRREALLIDEYNKIIRGPNPQS